MLRFDLEFFLAVFTHPVMLAIDEGMVMDAFAVIFGAEVALHCLYSVCMHEHAGVSGPIVLKSRLEDRVNVVVFQRREIKMQ